MAPCRVVFLHLRRAYWGLAEGISSARRVTHPHAGGVTMPLSSSFTDEGGGFASFLHQVQKSYVPERDIDGRKFDKAMSRLRARLEETTTARAELGGDLDLRRREDEDRVSTVLTGITAIRFLALRAAGGRVPPPVAVELLADRRDVVRARRLVAPDVRSRRQPNRRHAEKHGVVTSYFSSLCDGHAPSRWRSRATPDT